MYGIVIAFKKYNPVRGIAASPWVGLSYFRQFFASPSSWTVVLNTIRISVGSLVFGFPVPILLAIALNECSNQRFRKIVQMITYAPYFISTVVLVGIILQITDLRMGVINLAISMLGGKPINFMGRPEFFTPISHIPHPNQKIGYFLKGM
jgi:putative aldouronate transport system permease protein